MGIEITKKSLETLSSEILVNMIDLVINGIKTNTVEEKQAILKSKGYVGDHRQWGKKRLIEFILKFKPALTKN